MRCPACHADGELPLWETRDATTTVRSCTACGRGMRVRRRIVGPPRIDLLPMPIWNAMQIARRDQDAARTALKPVK